nr:hypothetical protein [uncultured Aminipila sp.]
MGLEISTDMAITVFLETVDYLMLADSKQQSKICAWTNKKQYANFIKNNFETIFRKKVCDLMSTFRKDYPKLLSPSDYKQFMLIFREMGWLVCQKERFTSTQWINDKAYRVITVHYPRYLCLKKMESYRIQKEKEKIEQKNKEKAKTSNSIEQLPPLAEIPIAKQIDSNIEKATFENVKINKITKKASLLDKIKEKLPQ